MTGGSEALRGCKKKKGGCPIAPSRGDFRMNSKGGMKKKGGWKTQRGGRKGFGDLGGNKRRRTGDSHTQSTLGEEIRGLGR